MATVTTGAAGGDAASLAMREAPVIEIQRLAT
jgi:hypothetical protein